jgi:uncharacterized membrane protein YfcA
MALTLAAASLLGFLTGLGIGGGSLLILWLTLAADMDPIAARGINLLFFLPTAAVSLLFHRKNGLLDKQVIRHTVPVGILSAAAAAWLATAMDTQILRKPFGLFLLFTGISMLCQTKVQKK